MTTLLNYFPGVDKLAANFKAAAPFQAPAEASRPSGGETYRGRDIPPKYQAPAPYQPPAASYHPPAAHLQSAHPAHPSNRPAADLDPRDFMPVGIYTRMCSFLLFMLCGFKYIITYMVHS